MDKLDKNLMVEIPKRFEKDLKAKFNLIKMDKNGDTNYLCPLCKLYLTYPCNCGNCPFAKFEISNLVLGCSYWKRMITKKRVGFYLASENYPTIINVEEFKAWRKIATRYIKFV